jgi:hypothetical protein
VVAATSCQHRQIRVSQDAAVATATKAADFTPQRTQVRLVRQGLNGHPYWAISMSIPGKNGQDFARIAVARVDANNGKLVALTDTASKEGAP